ncbi:hypothetical protein EVAR_92789_1 [Eumeta japonica]|uniref:Uncharacterized protein n=1 Tax=Eumeta variegata TaxID=151549 RepID=A0A4C2ABA5_EUMVA|nr:hypothetical protein EVAR_92789_1 [Eumeta japonica]
MKKEEPSLPGFALQCPKAHSGGVAFYVRRKTYVTLSAIFSTVRKHVLNLVIDDLSTVSEVRNTVDDRALRRNKTPNIPILCERVGQQSGQRLEKGKMEKNSQSGSLGMAKEAKVDRN